MRLGAEVRIMEMHVIFGTGAVGAAVMRALIKRGKAVRMINRSGKPSQATGRDLPANVEICTGDAYNADDVRRLTEGATAVYQGSQPEYHEWAEKFPPLQAGIIEGVAASGAKLIVIENLYMYGDPAGKALTESSPLTPNSGKGQVRLAMHESLMAAHHSGKVRVAVGRASDYYGEGYALNGDQIFRPALAGKKAQGMGNLDALHTFTYTPDVGEALAVLGERDEALGQVWHIPSAAAITQRDLITQVFKAAGHEPKIGAINKLMMRMAGLFVPGAHEMIEMMYEFEKPFVVDSSKFTRAFGMTATPYSEGIPATVAWFKANPKDTK
jgi:nucleoside-diphosphate-sugar epimerase